jgi:hypothetical protein
VTVSGTDQLQGVACSSSTTCYAVGYNSSLEGVVVPITSGTPGSAVTVSGTDDLYGVACSSSTTCYAVGYNSSLEGVVATVALASPTLSTTSSGNGTVGGSFTDSATLSDYAGTVTGETVDFTLYPSESDCTGATDPVNATPVTATLNSSGVTGQSSGITVNTPGTYYWQASYAADSDNNAAASSCSGESITVGKATPNLFTTSGGNAVVGGSVTDSAYLNGFADSVSGETVSFSLYPTLADCTGATGALSGSPVTANLNSEGVTPQSPGITVTNAGTYYWGASYPGDADNNAVTSSCSSEQITVGKAATSITTHATVVRQGGLAGIVTFSATLTSQVTGHGLGGQTITFRLSGPFAFILNIGFGSGSSCTGTTNSSGVASCTLSTVDLGVLILTPTYTAAFAGSTDYLATSATGKINAFGALF